SAATGRTASSVAEGTRTVGSRPPGTSPGSHPRDRSGPEGEDRSARPPCAVAAHDIAPARRRTAPGRPRLRAAAARSFHLSRPPYRAPQKDGWGRRLMLTGNANLQTTVPVFGAPIVNLRSYAFQGFPNTLAKKKPTPSVAGLQH